MKLKLRRISREIERKSVLRRRAKRSLRGQPIHCSTNNPKNVTTLLPFHWILNGEHAVQVNDLSLPHSFSTSPLFLLRFVSIHPLFPSFLRSVVLFLASRCRHHLCLPTSIPPSLSHTLSLSLSLSLSAALSFSFHFYITTTFPHSSHDFLPANSSPSRSSLFLLWSRLISFSRSTSYIVSSILSLVLLVHFSPLFFYPPLPLTFPPLPTRSTLTYRRHSPSYAMPTTRPYRPFPFSTIYHYLVSLQFAFSASLFPDFLFPTSSTFPSSRRVCIDSRVKTFSIVE